MTAVKYFSFKSLLLIFTFVSIHLKTAWSHGSYKEQFEIRKEKLTKLFLNQNFEEPKVGTLNRPNFNAPVQGLKTRPKSLKPTTFSRSFTREHSTEALLLLSQNIKIAKANEYFMKVCQFYLNCDTKHLTAPDSFYWATETYLHLYHKFSSKGKINPGLLNLDVEDAFIDVIWRYTENTKLIPIKVLDLSFNNDGYWYLRSENHWFMEVVTLWSFCEILSNLPKFKNRLVPSMKRSVLETANYLTEYFKVYIKGRASKGFLTEISAGAYCARMLAMFSSISNYASDRRLKEMAKDIQDLYWCFWAEEQVGGERGGGKVRHRSWIGLIPNKGLDTNQAWLYFGTSSLTPELIIRNEKAKQSTRAMFINMIYSSYYPNELVLKILDSKNHHNAYEIIHRRVGKSVEQMPKIKGIKTPKAYDTKGHVLKYSWCDKNFILGTCMRPPLKSTAWPIGSTQSWHHGLILTHDNHVERVIPKVLIQDSFNEQYSVQSKGTLISRRLPSERNGNIPMGFFISNGLRKYLIKEQDNIFINCPNVYIALRFVHGGYRQLNINEIDMIKDEGLFFKNNELYSPVILEVASPNMFTDFSSFKEKVLSQKTKIINEKLDYQTIYGDTLTLFTQPNQTPLINGQHINYHPKKVYSSPFIQSIYGSGIIEETSNQKNIFINFNLE